MLREKWRLDRLIGLGGMAAVYAATHRNGKQAAIKILHPQAAMVADIRARFLREGYLANRVHHPGALSILDDDVDTDGTVFLVMELLQGETLEARWQLQQHMPWQEVCVVIDRMLDILVAAHTKSIVHRDLKPGNVFIEDSGGIKILDFGIARLHSVAPEPGDTARDTALGTPGFMPPEQARGRWSDVDAQSDVWAVGATAFAVLTGRYVHEAPTLNEQLLAAMTEPAPPVRSLAPDVPEPFAALIDRALAFDKQHRWEEARAMQRALRDAYQEATGEPFTSAPPISKRSGDGSRSVQPDAPTVSASDLVPDRRSTARPVSAKPQAATELQPGRRALFAGVAIFAVVVAAGGWALLFGPDDGGEPQEPPSVAAPAAPAPTVTAAAAYPAATASTRDSDAAAPELTETPKAPSAQTSTGAPAPRPVSRPRALPRKRERPAAQTGDGVDIFTRRK